MFNVDEVRNSNISMLFINMMVYVRRNVEKKLKVMMFESRVVGVELVWGVWVLG